jgi:hypothetical protein
VGEVAATDEAAGFLGADFFEPGEAGDLVFTGLDAGPRLATK